MCDFTWSSWSHFAFKVRYFVFQGVFIVELEGGTSAVGAEACFTAPKPFSTTPSVAIFKFSTDLSPEHGAVLFIWNYLTMELEVVIGGINQLLTPVKGGANIFQTLDETLKGFHTFLDSSNQSRLRAAHYDTITDLTIPKYDSERQAMSCKEDVNRYCQFTLQALALLCLLDDSLKKAHADDLNSAMERSGTHHEKEKQHFTPKALLSPAEEKKIHTLLQFVVALGVFPFLIPGADNLLRLQLGEMAALIKKCNGDDNIQAFFLYHHCRLVSRLFTTPVIGPSIVTRHLSTVLVAVMQICYAPREQQKHGTEDGSHIFFSKCVTETR